MTDSKNSLAIAYKLLNVHSTCTIDELRGSFKQLAIRYHPDKGGDENIFNLIVDGFKTILHHIKTSEEQKEHFQLKSNSVDNTNNTNTNENSNYQLSSDNNDKNEFNSKFNNFFNKHKTIDENIDRGYQHFINEVDVKTSKNHYKLQKYHEPEGSIHCNSLGFHELGNKTKDYSGKNQAMNKLQFMDYQYAHTTSKLIDPSLVKQRQEYESIDQLRSKRDKETFDLTDKEKNFYEKVSVREKKKEQKRVNTLLDHDNYLSNHQIKMNTLKIS